MAADLVVVNGRVWPPGSGATAVAIAGEAILAAGGDRAMRDLASPGARVIDAGGGSILPAFNDAHVHFLNGARGLSGLDLFACPDLEAVEAAIRGRVAELAPGAWLAGRGWQYALFPGGMPDRDRLDRLCPGRPAFLEAYDGHTAWVNGPALALAGLTGEADAGGILKEERMALVEGLLPAPTREQDLASLRRAIAMAHSRGVVSVQEAGAGQDQVALYRALRDGGELTLRVRLGFDLPPGLSEAELLRRLDGYRELDGDLDGRQLSGGILKAFADGVVESRTAAMLEPYQGGTDRGRPNWDWAELARAVAAAAGRGWQVQIHAIGDAAVRVALDAFAATAPGRRHRVEHVETIAAADLARFGGEGVVASMQPAHAEPGRNLLEAWAPQVGPERAARAWAWRSIAAAGGALAFGSDWPVVPMDPARALHVAVTRTTAGGDPAGGWQPAERLSLAAAVHAHTASAAHAEHAESWKGSLLPGMAADLAILHQDLEHPGCDLAGVTVAATIAGGRLVYEGPAAS